MKKYVAYLDILGFTELIEKNSAEEIQKIYSDALTFSNNIYNNMFGPELIKVEDAPKVMIVSDSIIIWTVDTTQEAFCIVTLMTQFLISAFLTKGLPIRGAIDVGEIIETKVPTSTINHLHFNNSIILGNGLTNAFKLEKNQRWAGCVVSENALLQFNASCESETKKNPERKIATLNDLLYQNKILIEYKVPLKSGEITNYYVIDWVSVSPHLNEARIRHSFSMHNKKTNTWEVEQIIQNTLSFFNYVKKLKEE